MVDQTGGGANLFFPGDRLGIPDLLRRLAAILPRYAGASGNASHA
jgi:hypothetical protein